MHRSHFLQDDYTTVISRRRFALGKYRSAFWIGDFIIETVEVRFSKIIVGSVTPVKRKYFFLKFKQWFENILQN